MSPIDPNTASEEEIIGFLRERLTRYKVPSAVEFRAELPKTMIGKLDRKALKAEVLGSEVVEAA